MNVKHAALFFLFLLLPGVAQAKLFLLLDERLKKSKIEQAIYKFVPVTNASEVELNYVQGFLKDASPMAYAVKLKGEDRGIYIGADSWPDDSYINELTQSRTWPEAAGKISFLIESNAPSYARMPKGFFPRHEFWKKYAELTNHKYGGFFNLHFLDTNQNSLENSEWRSYTCAHETGRVLKPGKGSPLVFSKNQFQMVFRHQKQLDFIGSLVCINTPKIDTIFEIHTEKTDVEIHAEQGRFSIWNEAQPLKIKIIASRQITAPLSLQIVPEVNESQTEFFFQGDRISCTSNRCRKKDATFLLPQFRDFQENFELAIRASGDSYFRGSLRLLAGDIEVARTRFKFTPQSWVAETAYALKNPSEYQSVFLYIFAAILAGIGLLVLIVHGLRKLARSIAERNRRELPRQSSATTTIELGVTYRMTAGENPFGCELYAFGGIVSLRAEGNFVAIKHGGVREETRPIQGFRYSLPDGYVLEIQTLPEGGLKLDVYLMSLVEAT